MSEWFQIENKEMVIQITSLGAELKRLFSRKWNRELLWGGDLQVWNRSAPILFPIVGKLKDNTYELFGKKYQLNQHGFARDTEFKCTQFGENSIELFLTATQETFISFPFCFDLFVSYKIIDNKLHITHKVINTDRQDIFFSIGGHPAFETTFLSDYEIRFSENEEKCYQLKNGLVNWKNEFEMNGRLLPLSKELFINDAMIFKNVKSKIIDLVNKENNEVIRLHIDSPYLGIWGKGDCPFICIEPWHGIADTQEHSGQLPDKEGIITLPKGETFLFEYSIELLTTDKV